MDSGSLTHPTQHKRKTPFKLQREKAKGYWGKQARDKGNGYAKSEVVIRRCEGQRKQDILQATEGWKDYNLEVYIQGGKNKMSFRNEGWGGPGS